MGLIAWIILGALAGWLASLVMGTNREQGCLMDIVVGVAGALLGGFIFSFFGGAGVSGLNVYSLLVAVVGAIVLLAIVKAFRRG